MRVNYTTYDIRRDQDCINPRVRSDAMFLSGDSEDLHPYVYGRVCGIFHAFVQDNATNKNWSTEEFLLVCWYKVLEPHLSGFQAKHLYRVAFLDSNDAGAFSVVDPAHVVRAAHIIPRFKLLGTRELMGTSLARREEERNRDYKEYYINM